MRVHNIGFLVDPETQQRIAYDRDTGQVLRETMPPVVFLGKPRAFNDLYGRGRWWIMSDTLAEAMAFDKELSRQEPTRVFWYMVKRLDFENYIRVPQAEIAEALEMKRSNVSKAIALLESKGVLLRGPKVGPSYSWRLNPNCGFKGDPSGKIVKFSDGKLGFSRHHEITEEDRRKREAKAREKGEVSLTSTHELAEETKQLDLFSEDSNCIQRPPPQTKEP